MPPDTFGQWIRSLRVHAGLFGYQLAAAAGVSGAFISDMEHDKRTPSDETAGRLAAALGVDADLVFARLGRLPPDLAQHLRLRPEDMSKVRAALRGAAPAETQGVPT